MHDSDAYSDYINIINRAKSIRSFTSLKLHNLGLVILQTKHWEINNHISNLEKEIYLERKIDLREKIGRMLRNEA